jgi:ribose transport system permease protein
MTSATSETVAARSGFASWRQFQSGLGLIAMFILVMVVMSRLSPFFMTSNNLINMLLASSTISMIAVFTTMLMVSGGLDLSVAAVAALTGIIISQYQEELGIWGAAGVGVLVATLAGLFNGVMVTYVGINPFITFGYDVAGARFRLCVIGWFDGSRI